ncbi:UNVERIFIED_CONTAM: hypothetical protein K2H54_055511 [Gekko kuhli]
MEKEEEATAGKSCLILPHPPTDGEAQAHQFSPPTPGIDGEAHTAPSHPIRQAFSHDPPSSQQAEALIAHRGGGASKAGIRNGKGNLNNADWPLGREE